jgi:negative regulator of replication initiation
MGIFDTIKSGVKSIWGNIKDSVKGVHDFLTSGKASQIQKTIGQGLNLLSGLGAINKDTATNIKSSIGKGLSTVHDVTKKANEIVDYGDKVGNILDPNILN